MGNMPTMEGAASDRIEMISGTNMTCKELRQAMKRKTEDCRICENLEILQSRRMPEVRAASRSVHVMTCHGRNRQRGRDVRGSRLSRFPISPQSPMQDSNDVCLLCRGMQEQPRHAPLWRCVGRWWSVFLSGKTNTPQHSTPVTAVHGGQLCRLCKGARESRNVEVFQKWSRAREG